MTHHTRLEPATSLADLIALHRRETKEWNPETDGFEFDVADQIRVALMADCGLCKADADYLTGTIL